MSWTDWACLGLFVFGFLLFLYAANNYNALVGYIGTIHLVWRHHCLPCNLRLQRINQKDSRSKTVKAPVLFSQIIHVAFSF